MSRLAYAVRCTLLVPAAVLLLAIAVPLLLLEGLLQLTHAVLSSGGRL